MASISFEALYDHESERALAIFLLWLEDFFEGLGGVKVAIDEAKAKCFVMELGELKKNGNFPANGGFTAASPFKKAALMYVYLHQDSCNPFIMALGAKTKSFLTPSGIASVVGFALVQACLDGAEITKDKQLVKLGNRINVSQHFMNDLIEASQNIGPDSHFKAFSLLFESLAYQTNNSISYDRAFDKDIPWDRPAHY